MAINFSDLLRDYRNELGLTFDKLGLITGLSKQYLHNLQNYTLKSLSLEKLKDVVLLLSQKEIFSEQEKYILEFKDRTIEKKSGRRKKGEGSPSYFDKYGFPKPEDLDLTKFIKLLFTSTGLNIYEKISCL
ncbi:MAG: hypothetical protein IPN76_14215 [Saprospiraceae bacterium]|nr:hypothetical protein [Saprospiraceae bacterium]